MAGEKAFVANVRFDKPAPKPKEPVSVKHECNDGYRLSS